MRDLLLRLPFVRRTADRFVAGETLPEALRAAAVLNRDGFRVTLDHLGESVRARESAEVATGAYLASLEAIRDARVDSTISLKLTQLGLELEESLAREHLRRIVRRASELGNFVRVDMEGSRHTAVTLRIFRDLFAEHRNVGVVIQAYLRRSAEDVEELVRLRAPVRLCKGAYREPPSVAFQTRAEVDASFVRLMRRLLDGGGPVAIATHDERMIEATLEHARSCDLAADAFELQMLYGVRRDFQGRLVSQGYRVRIYVPYGSEWYAYFMRRMAERPANLWFVLRAIAGG